MRKLSEMSRDSSTSFEDTEEARVRKFAKHMLKSSLFIGTFMEKRFVEPLNSYRDVIKVGDDEKDLIENLVAVRKRCTNYFSEGVWTGITEPRTVGAPAGYNLWVTLNEQEVFGSYWYKIKNVEFYSNEVRIKLEVVRPVSRERTPVSNVNCDDILNDVVNSDFKGVFCKLKSSLFENLGLLYAETLTWSNLKHAVIFLFLLISTLITFLVQTIQYLLDYVLKLLHEMSGLIKVCTPIIISFMKLIMNTINGFYALIAVLWRNRSPPQVHQNVFQMTPYTTPNYNRRSINYPSAGFVRNRNSYGSSVKITPLD